MRLTFHPARPAPLVAQFGVVGQTRLCSWVPFLCAVISFRKALLERRDQRVLELWLLGKS
jgi:hypothetical protein